MRVTMGSESTPGRANDDYAVSGLDWVMVFDGATALRPDENGCIHDVPWVVHHLAGQLARRLSISSTMPLTDALSESIFFTRSAHETTCDLSNPDSPSSTVTILRRNQDKLDYLVLADSPLLLRCGSNVQAITDDRMANLTDYSYEAVIAVQNKPGGYYVASTMPEAAYEAVYGSIDASLVDAAALLTDGASRLVDLFGQMSWEQLFKVLSKEGPSALIAQTREIETKGVTIDDGRTRKRHDDATAVLVEFNR
ncbi:hypothetical protein ACFV4N_32515 [Actinosynnema sp. NPDC059797]